MLTAVADEIDGKTRTAQLQLSASAQAVPHSDVLEFVTFSIGVVGAQATRERSAEWFPRCG